MAHVSFSERRHDLFELIVRKGKFNRRLQLFTAWVVVSLIWLFFALLVANFYPLVDGGAKKIWLVVKWRQAPGGQESSGVTTPNTGDSPDGLVSKEVVLPEKHDRV